MKNQLPYDWKSLKRESCLHYIPATDAELSEMMGDISINHMDELYAHIDKSVKFENFDAVEGLPYEAVAENITQIADKNKLATSFIGDGLQQYSIDPIVPYVAANRGLATAYTPYQPERSQGTLYSLWNYSCALSAMTGFEAINASFYDRSTCLYEAIQTGLRIKRGKTVTLISDSIYPGDKEVLQTLAKYTEQTLVYIPTGNGQTDLLELEKAYSKHEGKVASIVFPQTTHFGTLENVNRLTDFARERELLTIAVIDPILIVKDGLRSPSSYGTDQKGADMIVGEGQHLAIGPNFGGPGLGIFGIRFNSEQKNHIRSTAGRFIGKTVDQNGKTALSIILSTREQHIRREKATSNICSNQSFIASLAGAAMLSRGHNGLQACALASKENARKTLQIFQKFSNFKLAFDTPFFNEFTLEYNGNVKELLKNGSESGLHLGVDVSERENKQSRSLLLVSCSDLQSEQDLEKLESFLSNLDKEVQSESAEIEVPNHLLQQTAYHLPKFELDDLKKYYDQLGKLNVSPDDHVYPLGSCTMKYNPYLNEFAANLSQFTDCHPQAPASDVQGNLEVLFESQEIFKKITGLPGVTTEPVAGAQGELVGLKMFQAYHDDRGEGETRDIVLIPRSAHGTNPATATMAGYITKKTKDVDTGIVTIEANKNGQIDFEHFTKCIETYKNRIAAIMITNPNTSGIFETDFKKIADAIHSVGGLVYMDGANMNAICGHINLGKLGVDAVHNNLHKTWSIPHGGGGPGDAIVAVSDKLIDYLPGYQVKKEDGIFSLYKTPKSIGRFHRHYGNFAHKVRCYTYLKVLGNEGIKRISSVSVLAANYLYNKLNKLTPTLPASAEAVPRMHEFILTLSKEDFQYLADNGIPKSSVIAKVGKLFLDFGIHAPTVAFPEVYGLMIEPTESFTKKELDDFIKIVEGIFKIIREKPQYLKTVPHFTPVRKVDEVRANRDLLISETLEDLPKLQDDKISPQDIQELSLEELTSQINVEHTNQMANQL